MHRFIFYKAPRRFQNTVSIDKGISDFHKTLDTSLKMFYKKQKPQMIHRRKYDNF